MGKRLPFSTNQRSGGIIGYDGTAEESDNARRVRQALRASPTQTPRQNLVASHGYIATTVAQQYRGRGLSMDDLVSEAMLGLCHAAEEYDPERGQFSTYAFWVCRRFVHTAIRQHRHGAGQSIGTQRKLPALWDAIQRLSQHLQRQPTAEELAVELKWTVTQVTKLWVAGSVQTVSLEEHQEQGDDEGHSLLETVPDHRICTPEARVEVQQELSTIIRQRQQLYDVVMAMSRTDSSKQMFFGRYRLGESGVRMRTESQVAELCGVSESRVSQVLSQMWFRLRRDPRTASIKHLWLRALPERVTALADLLGEEVIISAFGPREDWEYVPKQRSKPMPRIKLTRGSGPLTAGESNLLAKLQNDPSMIAQLLLGVVSRLPLLSEHCRQVISLRMGFADGSLDRLSNSETAKRLKLDPQKVAQAMFSGIELMKKRGLNHDGLNVSRLNSMVDKIREQWMVATPTVTSPSVEQPTQLEPGVVYDLRDRLVEFAIMRRKEEQVIRLWLVGTEEHFGPMEVEDIARLLERPLTEIMTIISFFVRNAVETK